MNQHLVWIRLMERVFRKYVSMQKKMGKAFYFQSHFYRKSKTLADRVRIISEGKIIETGTLSALRHLTRTNLLVETKLKVIGLQELEVFLLLKKQSQVLSFQVDAEELDMVIKYVHSSLA